LEEVMTDPEYINELEMALFTMLHIADLHDLVLPEEAHTFMDIKRARALLDTRLKSQQLQSTAQEYLRRLASRN
jgi:hypothetical protein